MVEQYIYSRAQKQSSDGAGRHVSLGYGFMGLSDHMTDILKRDAQVHCGENLGRDLRDERGNPTPIWRKVRLKESGKTLLQYCTPLYSGADAEKSHRMFHVSHGYIVDGEDAVKPLQWFRLKYYTSDPNRAGGPIPLDEADLIRDLPDQYRTGFTLKSLELVMSILHLNTESFLQMVLACFDAVAEKRRVLIAYDPSAPEAEELKKQILSWLYLCLPFDLRRVAGAESEYTVHTSAQFVQVVFVPRNRVQIAHNTVTFQLESPVSLDADYLVMDGTIRHNASYGGKWFGKDTLLSRWLRRVVDALLRSGCNGAVLTALGEVYQEFDRQMQELHKADASDLPLYNTLCWMQLAQSENPVMQQINRGVVVSEEEEMSCQMTLMREFAGGRDVGRLLDRVVRRHTVPAGEADLKLLVQALGTDQRERALHILGAFLVAEADAPGADLGVVLHRYQALAQDDTTVFSQLMDLFALGDPVYEEDWRQAGVNPGPAAAASRRKRWGKRTLNNCTSLDQLPDRVENFGKSLPCAPGTTPEALAAEVLGIATEWLTQRYPVPALSEILDLARGVYKHFREEDSWIYIQLLQTLANNYEADPDTTELENLEQLQQAFQPMESDAVAQQCWVALCDREMEALSQRGLSVEGGAAMLKRWNNLLNNSPLGRNETAIRFTELLYEHLLQNPAAFVSAGWPDQPVIGEEITQSDAKQALVLLNNFAKSSSDTVKTWYELLKDAPQSVQEKARGVLPSFFAAGLLPKVQGVFLCYIIHLQVDDLHPVLVQAARQGGAKLLQGVLTLTRRYARHYAQYRKTDLQMLLEAISGDDEVLDVLHDQTREKTEFGLWLADSAAKMQKAGVIRGPEVQMVVGNLRDYYNRRNYRKLYTKLEKYA